MKKIVLVFLTAFLVSGCPEMDRESTYIRTVKNESGVPIEIRGLYNPEKFLPPVITRMNVGQKITKKQQTSRWYDFNNFFGRYRHPIDSLVVIYDNRKKTSFVYGCSDTIPNIYRNPLSCVYGKKEETFTFTAEDYENATPCNGDCE